MNKKSVKQLITALQLIQHTATQAWWYGRSAHCGSDFDRITCEPCFAFGQCTRQEELKYLFSELHRALGI